MPYLFCLSKSLINLNISNFNTENVVMENMFYDCKSLKMDISKFKGKKKILYHY